MQLPFFFFRSFASTLFASKQNQPPSPLHILIKLLQNVKYRHASSYSAATKKSISFSTQRLQHLTADSLDFAAEIGNNGGFIL